MSTFALPRDLTRRARLVLFAAFTVSGDDGEVTPEGKPPSAAKTLMRLTGFDGYSNVWHALTELQHAGYVVVRRDAAVHGALRVRLVLATLQPRDACEVCGSIARGTGRWCARCKQIHGRDDRSWQIRALELHESGLSPVRIAVVLDRPLYVASADDGRNPNGGAVVPYLVERGVLGDEWRERLREATRGASVEEP